MADELVLYRKYRPQDFSEVFGQEHVVAILQNALIKKRIAHAYLFSGPRGSGKTSIARIFARSVNCLDPTIKGSGVRRSLGEGGLSVPCNTCDICKEFMRGNTLDLIEIDAASNRGIDEVRALKEGAYTLPFKSKYKIYIIDEIHMMTKEAFNALLKILEEPPQHIIFILATTEPEKVPETVISRTQHLRFLALPEAVVIEALAHVAKKENIAIDTEGLSLLSFLSEGSLRDALNFLVQVQGIAGKSITAEHIRNLFGIPARKAGEELLDAICAKNSVRAASAVVSLSKGGASYDIFLRHIIRNFRFLFLATLDPSFENELQTLIGKGEYDFLIQRKGKLSQEELRTVLATLLYTANVHYQSPYPSLPLELAVSKIMSVLEKNNNS